MSASVALDGGRSGAGSPAPGPAGQLGAVLGDVRDELRLRSVGHVVAERFGEQLVRRREVLLAVPEQHARPVVERRAGRLGDERGLAESGLAGHEHDLAPVAGATRFDRVGHRTQLRLVPDHTGGRTHRQSAWEGQLRRGCGRRVHRCGRQDLLVARLPRHTEGLEGLPQALQLEQADGLEVMAATAPREEPHERADVDRARAGGRLQPCRLDDRSAVAVVGDIVHVARTDADPQHEVPPSGAVRLWRSLSFWMAIAALARRWLPRTRP